jgi:hypothetical protein
MGRRRPRMACDEPGGIGSNSTPTMCCIPLERDVFPDLGAAPIKSITAANVLSVLRKIENRPAIETARRIRQRVSAVFVYAIASGRAENDPAATVQKAMKPVKKGRQPAITDLEQARAIPASRGYDPGVTSHQTGPAAARAHLAAARHLDHDAVGRVGRSGSANASLASACGAHEASAAIQGRRCERPSRPACRASDRCHRGVAQVDWPHALSFSQSEARA